jgi:hypothetical protein
MQSLESAWRQITREFETAQAEAAESGRARVTGELNQVARRLRQYQRESDWCDAVLDGSAHFTSEAALFAVEREALTLRGTRNLALPSDLRLSLGEAKAFRGALDAGEPSIVLCTKGEVSEAIARAVSVNRAFVVPIANETRKVALLFAVAGQKADTNALELIAQIASSALRRAPQSASTVQIAAPPAQEPVAASPSRNNIPDWAGIPETEKLLHVRARRMARAKVAEMQLYRPEACRAGRIQANLYLFLKQEIDAARGVFRSQFMSTTSMIDYLHLEMLGQLAENDETILGADYPGQMA